MAFPELLKVAVPPIVDAANSISAFSVTATSAPVRESEPKVEDSSSKVMFCPLALMVVAPPMVKVPASVTSLEVIDRVPLIELASNCVASVFFYRDIGTNQSKGTESGSFIQGNVLTTGTYGGGSTNCQGTTVSDLTT